MTNNKINISDLLIFLERIHLNANVEQVRVTSQDGKLTAGFSTETRDLVGYVTTTTIPFIPDGTFAILNLSQFIRMCKLLESPTAHMSITTKNDRMIGINLRTDVHDISFAFGEVAIVPPSPSMTQAPNPDYRFNVDKNFSKSFINAAGVLNEQNMYIEYESLMKDIIVTIGDVGVNTNRIAIKTKSNLREDEDGFQSDSEKQKFSATFMRDILSTVRDDNSTAIGVSNEGLMSVCSLHTKSNVQSNYYLIKRT